MKLNAKNQHNADEPSVPTYSPRCRQSERLISRHYGPRLANVGCKALRHRGVICQTDRQVPQLDAALGGEAHARNFFQLTCQ